jgi:hypothetical protein
MNTILFAAARHAAFVRHRGETIPEDHPREFHFADDESRENYQRELRGEPLLHVCNPIVLVSGNYPWTGESSLVRSLIAANHGIDNAWVDKDFRGSEPRLQRIIEDAIVKGRPYVWFDNVSGHIDSEALAFFATVSRCTIITNGAGERYPVKLRFYLSGNDLRPSADILRRSRVIRLSRPLDSAA